MSSPNKPLDKVFQVATGNIDGTCDPYRNSGQLDKIFDDMVKLSATAFAEITKDSPDDNTQRLMKSLFSIDQNAAQTDEEKNANNELIGQGGDTDVRVQLYCDSTFMVPAKMSDAPALDENDQEISNADGTPQTIGEALIKSFAAKGQSIVPDDNWVFRIPSQRDYLPILKSTYGKDEFPSYKNRPNYPTLCAKSGYRAQTIAVLDTDIIVLCPHFFKKGSKDPPVSDVANLKKQRTNKVLDKMETRSLTWYHEIFHLVMEGDQSADQPTWLAKKQSDKKTPVPGFPAQKSAWVEADPARDAYGGIACMYLALYDRATGLANAVPAIDDILSIRNPESYAWFALALYLSVNGVAHQDWSSGACRPENSPPQVVTVTVKGGKTAIPRRAEPTSFESRRGYGPQVWDA